MIIISISASGPRNHPGVGAETQSLNLSIFKIFVCEPHTGCSKTSCKFLRLVTQSFFGLFPVFWAFLYHKLWAIFHSSTSGT